MSAVYSVNLSSHWLEVGGVVVDPATIAVLVGQGILVDQGVVGVYGDPVPLFEGLLEVLGYTAKTSTAKTTTTSSGLLFIVLSC